ncbi:MAG: Uma2 family endonuclease [Defluviitaleaceae bacterium]|nr:Uma2 family endonuclease [Defluviitaleaceae bacterium]
MIIEVLSPSTAYKDRVLKHRKYMEAGVKEYWLVYFEKNFLQNK